MIKKIFISFLISFIFFSFSGCITTEEIGGVDKVIKSNTSKKKKNKIEKSIIPNFNKIYNDTEKIEIVLNNKDSIK